jgi:acyl dehydratase
MRATPGEQFSEVVRLTPDDAIAFARAAGDHNPIHHDAEHVARTRYKRLIVSGTQTAARLMVLTATHFSRKHAVVRLDFSVRFHKPVFADETITVEWTVVAVSESPSLKGDVVEMKGRVLNQAGELAVGGTGRVLVTDQL